MTSKLLGTCATLVVCAACGSKSPAIDVPVNPMPPAAITDHVVFVDSARAHAVMFDVSGSKAPAAPTIVPVVPNPSLTVQRRSVPDQLLVLSSGHADDGTAPFAEAGLVVLNAEGKPASEFRYKDAFDAVGQSDDGTFAMLFFDQNAVQQPGTVFNFPNDYAVVNLTEPASSSNPYIHSFRSFGSSPRSVAFTKMTLNGELRDLAVVLFDTYVAIKDLNNLTRSEYTISLANPGDNIQLSKVIFSTATNKIYLEATGSDDIYVIKLSDGASPTANVGDGGTPNDFTPSVNFLGAGGGPTDMALYTVPGTSTEKLIVAAPGASQVVIIEPDTSNVTNVPLPGPANQILLFNGPSPSDPTTEPRALLYTAGGDVVTFVDLVDVETRGVQNVEALTVPQAYSSAVPLDASTVMLLQEQTGLSLLNLEDRTVAQIQGPNLADATTDPANQKLWTYTNDIVGFLDLRNGVQPDQVRVDAPIQALITVPFTSTSLPRVVVTHPSSMGWATVLDAADPTNLSEAYSMRGFLLSGVLQGGN